jgi:hypothetical protein
MQGLFLPGRFSWAIRSWSRNISGKGLIMESELVTVYTVSHAVEAEIVKNALEAEGISCYLEGINQAFEVGLVPQVKIQVPVNQAEQARQLIEAHEESRGEVGEETEEAEEGDEAPSSSESQEVE